MNNSIDNLIVAAIVASTFNAGFAEAAKSSDTKLDHGKIFANNEVHGGRNQNPSDFIDTSPRFADGWSQNEAEAGTGSRTSFAFGREQDTWDSDDSGRFGGSWLHEASRPTGHYNLSECLDWDTPNVPAVPEPETYVMFLAGLGMIGFMTCYRKISS